MAKKTQTGAEALIKMLENKGIKYIFGYPGGAAIPLFDAIYDSSIELVLTRHEQGATHMADAYARVSGQPGVVLVTSGPVNLAPPSGPGSDTPISINRCRGPLPSGTCHARSPVLRSIAVNRE